MSQGAAMDHIDLTYTIVAERNLILRITKHLGLVAFELTKDGQPLDALRLQGPAPRRAAVLYEHHRGHLRQLLREAELQICASYFATALPTQSDRQPALPYNDLPRYAEQGAVAGTRHRLASAAVAAVGSEG